MTSPKFKTNKRIIDPPEFLLCIHEVLKQLKTYIFIYIFFTIKGFLVLW